MRAYNIAAMEHSRVSKRENGEKNSYPQEGHMTTPPRS